MSRKPRKTPRHHYFEEGRAACGLLSSFNKLGFKLTTVGFDISSSNACMKCVARLILMSAKYQPRKKDAAIPA